MNKIYLDHAATSPVHPQVIERMTSVLAEQFGNPSSIHSFGRDARCILDEARLIAAKSIHAQMDEIIYTSGGTEADNLAIFGIARANKSKGKHIITSTIEHHAVLHACEYLEREGFEVTYIQPDEFGRVHVADIQNNLRKDTILVTIMYGNNEVGTIQPIKEIGALLSDHQAYFHTDAVQAFGVDNIDVNKMHIDLLSVSGHKINGPKGVGFLYIKSGTNISPNQFGGEQELKRRAGTENLPAIAGFAEAVEIAQETIDKRIRLYSELKRTFIETLETEKIEFQINGSSEWALPHVLNISFPEVDVEAMLVNLDIAGIAASSGSACTAGSIEPSHVLVAMFGPNSDRIRSSIRFSFGLGNTLERVAKAAIETAAIVRRLRN